MAEKLQIQREELRHLVLSAIREQPGCAGVQEIAVTPVAVVDQGSTWHVNVLNAGDVEFSLAHRAAKRVEERFEPQFECKD